MAQVTAQRGHVAAPYFSLAVGEWIPYAFTWDPETGEFRGVEGPRGFDTYREAVEASRFLGSHYAYAELGEPSHWRRHARAP
jgi:hypothetical protein